MALPLEKAGKSIASIYKGGTRMTSLTRNEFLTIKAWHRAVVGGKDIILRHTSALEYLEFFGGYMREKTIDVYAKRRGEYDKYKLFCC